MTLDSTLSWDTEEKLFPLDAFMEIIKKDLTLWSH
jgi:hypothetical protein